MKKYIKERVYALSNYLLNTQCTIRQAGKVFCVSKSTVHKDLQSRLLSLDATLHAKVCEILDENFSERHIRGGLATRAKYLKAKDKKQ
ncbi:MAG: sporulation transcriptional regulator SpoIIID [Clostridia bacterium]